MIPHASANGENSSERSSIFNVINIIISALIKVVHDSAKLIKESGYTKSLSEKCKIRSETSWDQVKSLLLPSDPFHSLPQEYFGVLAIDSLPSLHQYVFPGGNSTTQRLKSLVCVAVLSGVAEATALSAHCLPND